MGSYTIFFRCSKILGEAGKQEILVCENIRFYSLFAGEERGETDVLAGYKCSENSRSQIVFRTDIFRKLTLGAPDWTQH